MSIMKSKHRLAEFREKLTFYKVLTQVNTTTKLPEDSLLQIGCYFAKVERSAAVTETEGKREVTETWNCYIRKESCKAITIENLVKYKGTYYEVLDVQNDDIFYNRLIIKKYK